MRLAQAAMAQRDSKVSELCLELGVTKGDDLPLLSEPLVRVFVFGTVYPQK